MKPLILLALLPVFPGLADAGPLAGQKPALLASVRQPHAAAGKLQTPVPDAVLTLAAADGWTTYVNPRFGTRIDYPSGVFVALAPPANGDGRSFRSSDGQADFIVFGQFNVFGSSLAALREDDRTSGRYGSVTYERTGADWYVLSGYTGNRVYYRRVLLGAGGETVHVFEITYPASDKSRMDPVAARMSKSFGGP